MTVGSYDPYLPAPPLPQGHTPETWLRELTARGVPRRYGNHAPPELASRIEHELAVIDERHGARSMLIVAEYVNWAKQSGIWVGPGRGSVAGSAVAYALGITEVDPLRHGLMFERFLTTNAPHFVDIDVDIEWGRRGEVVAHLVRTYGSDCIAGIAAALADRPVHAAGILITNQPLADIVPAGQMPRTDQTSWLSSVELRTDLDYLQCESRGLVKFDLLELLDLRRIRRVTEAVEQTHGITLRPWSRDVPLDDPRTFQLLAAGDTSDVFQLGAPAVQRYLPELQPKRFQDLAAVVALFRPAPMERGLHRAFVERRHGRAPWPTVDPELDDVLAPLLDDTRGVLIYQEQLMEVAHRCAGMSLGEANRLRLWINSAKQPALTEVMLEFTSRVTATGHSKDAADALWTWLYANSAGAFNKAHAVSYALITYWDAYLQAHFPDEHHEAGTHR